MNSQASSLSKRMEQAASKNMKKQKAGKEKKKDVSKPKKTANSIRKNKEAKVNVAKTELTERVAGAVQPAVNIMSMFKNMA